MVMSEVSSRGGGTCLLLPFFNVVNELCVGDSCSDLRCLIRRKPSFESFLGVWQVQRMEVLR